MRFEISYLSGLLAFLSNQFFLLSLHGINLEAYKLYITNYQGSEIFPPDPILIRNEEKKYLYIR